MSAHVECIHCHSLLEVVPANLSNPRVPELLRAPATAAAAAGAEPASSSALKKQIPIHPVFGATAPAFGAAPPRGGGTGVVDQATLPSPPTPFASEPRECTGEVLCPVCDTTFKRTFDRAFVVAAATAEAAATAAMAAAAAPAPPPPPPPTSITIIGYDAGSAEAVRLRYCPSQRTMATVTGMPQHSYEAPLGACFQST